SGLETFYTGMGVNPSTQLPSTYAQTADEYCASPSNLTNCVTSAITYSGYMLDLSAAANGSQTSPILNEVCKMIQTPVANGYYPVYVDLARQSGILCVAQCGFLHQEWNFGTGTVRVFL